MKNFILKSGRKNIIDFCHEFEYPNEAKNALLSALEALISNNIAFLKMSNICQKYEENYEQNEEETVNTLIEIAEYINISKFTVNLLYFIFLVPHFKRLYIEKKYGEKLCRNILLDLKYKLFECKSRYNVWGNFVVKWTMGIFRLEVFGFGRLQFNLHKFQYTYTDKNYKVNEGEWVLSTHIPSSGPLVYEECLESYKEAEGFFKDYFKERPTVFYCSSWLLAPTNKLILPPHSRIRQFAEDFIILKEMRETTHSDLWRIFGVDSFVSVEDLPQENSLQKSFAKWLSRGEYICYATGILFYKDGKILY